MAELKTKATENSVQNFLKQITNETTLKDCEQICELMEVVSKSNGRMWGSAIIGFGDYQYCNSSGKTEDWFMMGFSPRKTNITLYIMRFEGDIKEEVLSQLGKHKRGKGCIYIKTLADINFEVLKEMCEVSYQNLNK